MRKSASTTFYRRRAHAPRTTDLVAAEARRDDAVLDGLDSLHRAVDTFRAQHREEVADLRRAVDRLEAEAARLTPSHGTEGVSPAHRLAVEAFLRRGDAGPALDARAAVRVGDDPSGGYLVPTVRADIDRLSQQEDPVFADARKILLTEGASVEVPVDLNNATSAFTGESGTRAETAAQEFALARIPLHPWYAAPAVTTVAIASIPGIYDFVIGAIGAARIRKWGAAFHTGNGVAQPRGFLTLPTAATADDVRPYGTLEYVASGDANGFVAPTTSVSPLDCLISLSMTLREPYRAGAAWYMRRSTLAELWKFKASDGMPLVREPLVSGQPFTLLGFPVRLDEFMPGLGAGAFPIAFGNMARAYTVAMHELTLVRDPFTKKGSVVVYVEQLVGGDVVNTEAIKLLKVATS